MLFATGLVVAYNVAQRTNLANWTYNDISCIPKNDNVTVEFGCAFFEHLGWFTDICVSHSATARIPPLSHVGEAPLCFSDHFEHKCRNTCDIGFVPSRMALSGRLRRFLLPWFVIFMLLHLECFVCLGENLNVSTWNWTQNCQTKTSTTNAAALLDGVACLLLNSHPNLSCPVKSPTSVDLFDRFEF